MPYTLARRGEDGPPGRPGAWALPEVTADLTHRPAMARSLATPPVSRRADPVVVGALVVAAGLRLLGLGAAPLAPAEAPFWGAAAAPGSMLPAIALASGIPPLGAGLAHLAGALGGVNELSVRWPAAAAGVALVALLVPLARRLGGQALARWAAWIAATSPFLVFYDRTATPLALATLLATLATWYYLFLPTGRRRALMRFGGAMLLLATASLATPLLVIAQGMFLWVRRARARLWWQWGSGVMVALVVALLWLGRLEPGAAEPVGGLARIGARLVRSLVAFALGETLPLWQPVSLAGLVLVGGLAGLGLWRVHRPGRQFLLIFGGVPLLLVSVAPQELPGEVPLVLWAAPAWPAFGLAVAAGVAVLGPTGRQVAFAGLAAVAAFGVGGVFQLSASAPPAFRLPLPEVVRFIAARAEPGDVVIATAETMLPHHAERHPLGLRVVDARAAAAVVAAERPPRVWYLALLPEEASAEGAPRWLQEHYYRVEQRSYGEPDPLSQALRQAQGVPEHTHLLLALYQRR
jgi:4-amino-4-deoxy-L-arabinose transferase-like glycosyltransferase